MRVNRKKDRAVATAGFDPEPTSKALNVNTGLARKLIVLAAGGFRKRQGQ
jgi:hypothetical protein